MTVPVNPLRQSSSASPMKLGVIISIACACFGLLAVFTTIFVMRHMRKSTQNRQRISFQRREVILVEKVEAETSHADTCADVQVTFPHSSPDTVMADPS